MSSDRISLGRAGEDAAIAYLKKHNYQILLKNYTNQYGEIDIIANEGDYLCFIEVKSRRNDRLGSPLEAVTPSKQKQIIKVAQGYLVASECDDIDIRFDVVGISKDQTGQLQVSLIKNAFES